MSLLNFHQSAVDTKRWKSPIKSEVESQKAWCFRIWCIFKIALHLNRLYQVVIWQGLIEKEWNLYAFKDKDNEGTYTYIFDISRLNLNINIIDIPSGYLMEKSHLKLLE